MNFTKLLYSLVITFLLVFSVRLVAIETPLVIYEKIALVGVFMDYTLFRSRKLE